MGEVEPEASQNDFELEISDLDESDLPARLSHRAHLLSRPPGRLLILLNGLLLLTVVLLLISTPSVRNLVSGIFIPPVSTPTATIVPGTDLFYITAEPSWGHLSVDRHSTSLPTIGVDPPLRLAHGQHVLTWQANPFQTQQCTLSIPGNYATDTCRLNGTIQLHLRSGISAWVITFSVSLATLSTSLRASLLQTAQTALDTQQSIVTVQPGERYALAPDDSACQHTAPEVQCYTTAHQPLRAHLHFQLDTNEHSTEMCIDPEPGCTFIHQDCRLFCVNSLAASSSTQVWDVFAPALSLWTFTTMDGQVLARDVPDNSAWDHANGQRMDEPLMELNITWDSRGWHVVSFDNTGQPFGYFSPVCAAAQENVGNLQPPADANGLAIDLQWQFVPATPPASGCVVVGTPHPGDLVTPTPTHAPPLVVDCLYRFGVLLAANQSSQQPLWRLPPADTYEQQLVQHVTVPVGH